MTLTFYRQLRISFMLAWVVAWNALLGVGILLDRSANNNANAFFGGMLSITLIGTSFLCLSVIYVPRVQTIALRTEATVAEVRRDMWFLAGLTAFLAIISVANLLFVEHRA